MSARHRRPEGDAGRPRRVEPQDGRGELPRPLAPCPPPLASSGPPALLLRPATVSTTCHSLSDRRAPCTASQTVGTCACSSATRPAGPSTLGLSSRCMGGWAEPRPLRTPSTYLLSPEGAGRAGGDRFRGAGIQVSQGTGGRGARAIGSWGRQARPRSLPGPEEARWGSVGGRRRGWACSQTQPAARAWEGPLGPVDAPGLGRGILEADAERRREVSEEQGVTSTDGALAGGRCG